MARAGSESRGHGGPGRRERALVWAGLGGVTLLAWAYLLHLARGMSGVMTGAAMGLAPALAPWTATDWLLTTAMWVVMMIGMMLPAAAPVVLTVLAVHRKREAPGGGPLVSAAFVLGYALAWGGFSVTAALAQGGLQRAALLSPMLATTSPFLGGALLLAAGGYQLTPLKTACLRHCRSPLGWLMTEWREGAGGALRMGLRHGLFCLGCCGLLMGILFVTGVMNLLWVAAIALFVLLERAAPGGVRIGRLGSLGLIAAGLVVLGRGVTAGATGG